MKKLFIYATSLLIVAYSCSSNTKVEAHNDSEQSESNHDHGDGVITLHTEQAEAIGLETEVVKSQVFWQVIKTSGQVVAAQGEERTIVATISGIVSFSKANANEGKAVGKGESLFSISSSHLADGDPVTKARTAYNMAKRDFERAELLIVDKLISQKEYNEIQLVHDNAKIAYNAIAGGGRSSGATISSPISGYIKSKLVSEGQFVNMGDPLMIVTQNNKLQLRADVSERYYQDLQTVKSANFRTPYDNALYKLSDMGGQLISYGKSANDSEFYIPVNFQFNNVANVMPGSYVEVFLLGNEKQNVLTLPKTSLIDEQGIYSVFRKVCEEEYDKREVKIGITDGERVEILSGLNVDDVVVTKGAFHVKLASASEAIPHGHGH